MALVHTALIVDDDSSTMDNHKKYLSENGFEITMAENGFEAVELFRAGNRYDLVIMDLDMPVMNGIQATKEIRAMGVHSLIVGMCPATFSMRIQEFIMSGIDDFFTTPMNMAKLVAIVGHLE